MKIEILGIEAEEWASLKFWLHDPLLSKEEGKNL